MNKLQPLASVEAVRRLEDELLALPQVDLAAQLLVHGQMAVRTIFIPAGTLLTGALTRCDNVCFASGDITVTTEEGPRRLTGFHVLPARAGAKRAGIAHADTWWATVHHTTLADPAAIEAEMSPEADRLQTRRLLPQGTP